MRSLNVSLSVNSPSKAKASPPPIYPLPMNTKILPILILPVLAGAPVANAALITYAPDANTTALFHFDEGSSATSTIDAISGKSATAFDGLVIATNPTPITGLLGSASFTGFGNAGTIGAVDHAFGFDYNGSGAFQADTAVGSPSADAVTLASLSGSDGSFTIDAMVRFTGAAVGGGNREILSNDSSSASFQDRGFRFRLNTSGQLEFNYIAPGAAPFTAAVPTSGTHAYAADTWFHTAITFEGSTNVAKFYWTRVDPSLTTANLLATGTENVAGGALGGPLILGNENRNNSITGLMGKIDEVRISDTVRTANQFIFAPVPEPGTAMTGALALALLGLRRRR